MKRRRREARSRAIDWKTATKFVLLAGGAIFVAWFAVRVAAVDALVRRNPVAAGAFRPADPRIPMRLAMMEFRQNGGRISPMVAQAAVGSLQKAPLADEPFLIVAVESLAKGDEERAEALLLEARRRDPRGQVVRLLLLDRYLRRGQVQGAAAEIAAIGRLVPGTGEVLTPQLAKFAVDPRTRAPLARVLQSDPGIRQVLLEHLAVTGADPEIVLQLAGPVAPTPVGAQPPRWQHLLLQSLVQKGQIERAHRLWTEFTGVAPDARQTVYDGSFRRLPGSPPFNWEFVSSAAGIAEPAKTAGLQVDYYGRADAVLASQLLVLKPGRYRLAFQAAGDVPDRGSSLSWRIACHPSQVELASVPITNVSYAPRQVRGEFVVPQDGCQAQWLRLVGTAAEFPTPLSVAIGQLEIEPAGTR